jgi:hypothetical protein
MMPNGIELIIKTNNMSNLKTVTSDYHAGMEQIFKVIEIHLIGGSLTAESLQKEKDHYLGIPVEEPTKEQLELIEVQEKTKNLEALYNALDIIPISVDKVKVSLASIGLEVVPIVNNSKQ